MAIEEYQNAVKEILRGVQYMIEEAAIKSQTQIYNGIYLGNGEVQLNGKVYTLPQYGGTSSPAVGSIVKVFVPNGNMSMAFFFHITQGGGGETTDHGDLTGRDAENQHPMSAITGLVSALGGKQSTISDLATIRSGAALGATALQSYTETDPVFSASPAASITSGDVSSWNAKGTYSKPSGGIPKTDLASVVQESLNKADTALQSFTETDPTVPSWAKAPSKPTYTATEVGAVAIAQGVAKSGKFLVVGSDGNVTTGEGGGGSSDIFIATYGTTTGQEMYDAYYAGKVIVAKKNDKYALLSLLVGASNIQFYRPNYDEYEDAEENSIEYPVVERWVCQGSTWRTYTIKNAPQHSSSHHSDGSDPIAPSDIGAIPTAQKGVANGVASLGADGKVPLSQLPVYDGSVS